jgi:transcriptional regulator with XRE-family HTH domain
VQSGKPKKRAQGAPSRPSGGGEEVDEGRKLADAIVHQLIEAIEASGETPYALAKRSGVSPSTLSKFLGGTRPNLTIETLAKLCIELGLTIRLEAGDISTRG